MNARRDSVMLRMTVMAITLFAFLMPHLSFADGDGRIVDVVATGYGTTVREATKAALRSAVEAVVGTIVDATTLVENDKLIEDEILTYSAGMVAGAKTIGEPKKSADGIYAVKVKASVKKGVLEEKLRAASAVNVTLDGADLFARMTAAKDNLSDAEAMIKSVLAKHKDCVVAEAIPGKNGKSPIDLDPKTGEVFVNVRVRVDQSKYTQFASEVVEKLGMMAELKTEVMDTGHKNGYEPDGWFEYKAPPAYLNRDGYVINTLVVMKNFRSGAGLLMRFEQNIAEAIMSNLSGGMLGFDVKLLDSMGKVMTSTQRALVYEPNRTIVMCEDAKRMVGMILPLFDIAPNSCCSTISTDFHSNSSWARDRLIKEEAIPADLLRQFERGGGHRNGFRNGLTRAEYHVRLGKFTPEELKSVGRLEIKVGHMKGNQFLE